MTEFYLLLWTLRDTGAVPAGRSRVGATVSTSDLLLLMERTEIDIFRPFLGIALLAGGREVACRGNCGRLLRGRPRQLLLRRL